VNAGQYEGLMAMLTQIKDRLPQQSAPFGWTAPMPGRVAGTGIRVGGEGYNSAGPAPVVDSGGPLGAAGQRGAHRALMKLLAVLDGWIEGAHSNHEALGHRGEIMPCWTQFHPVDIRRMVNDAASELGLSVEFADPEVATEDKTR